MAKLVSHSEATLSYLPVFEDFDWEAVNLQQNELEEEPDPECQISWFEKPKARVKPWATRFSLRNVKVSM